MQPEWISKFNCPMIMKADEYVYTLPHPDEITDALQGKRQQNYWLYSPILEEVMLAPGETTKLECVGASYSNHNGSTVQAAKFYRMTHTGMDDFILLHENGQLSDGLTFEELIMSINNLDHIDQDLR